MRIAFLVALTACGAPPRPSAPPAPAPVPVSAPLPVWTPEPPEPLPLLGMPATIVLEPLPPIQMRSPLDPHWLDVHADAPNPHYAIAEAFGASSWRDLCAARGRPKGPGAEAMLEYILAWCDERGLASTRDALFPLLHSRLADAVHADLADLLAAEPAATACAWLSNRHVDAREGLHDALVATYVALGRPDDAALVLQHLDRTDHPETGTRCLRLARERPLVDLERRARIDLAIEQTAMHSTDPACHVPRRCPTTVDPTPPCDATCSVTAIFKEWLPCRRWLESNLSRGSTDGDDIVRRHWPIDTSPQGWRLFATNIVGVASDEVALAALTNAVRLSDCSSYEVYELEAAASKLWDRGGHARDPRFAELQGLTEASCRAFPR